MYYVKAWNLTKHVSNVQRMPSKRGQNISVKMLISIAANRKFCFSCEWGKAHPKFDNLFCVSHCSSTFTKIIEFNLQLDLSQFFKCNKMIMLSVVWLGIGLSHFYMQSVESVIFLPFSCHRQEKSEKGMIVEHVQSSNVNSLLIWPSYESSL